MLDFESREELIKYEAEKEKIRLENWSKAILEQVGTPRGRKILCGILEQCGVYRRSYTGNSETFFNEGKRDIGLWIVGEIQRVKPSAYTQMLMENFSEKKQLEKEKEQWLKKLEAAS
jgi:hypothetical protein